MDEKEINRSKQFTKLAYVSLLIMVIITEVVNCIQYSSSIKNENRIRIGFISKPYVSKVQTAVKYGKSIEEYYGIEKLLVKNKEQSEEIIDVAIAFNSGIRFKATNKTLEGTSVANRINVDNKWRLSQETLTKVGDKYILTIPILKADRIEAYYEVIIAGNNINSQRIRFILFNAISGGISFAIGCVFCFLLLKKRKDDGKQKEWMQLKIIGVIICTLVMIQVSKIAFIDTAYQSSTKQICLDLAVTMYDQIEEVINDKKLSYNSLKSEYALQDWIEDYASKVERIKSVYTAVNIKEVEQASYYWPQEEGSDFYIGIICDRQYMLNKQLKNLIYSGILVLVMFACMKICVEVMLQKKEEQQDKSSLQIRVESNIEKMSLLSFCASSICFLPTMFLPMVTTAMQNGDKVIICSMAIGAIAFGQLIATWFTRPLVKVIKWRYFLGIGSIVLCVSLWVSALVGELYYFMICRFGTGFAYGMIQTAIMGSLFHEVDIHKKNSIYQRIIEANRLGIIVGLLFGCVLYGVLGKQEVYFVSTALAIVFYFTQRIVIKDVPLALTRSYESKIRRSIKKRMLHVLFLLMVILPTSFYGSIISYYIPIYIQYQHHISASFTDLSAICMLFGTMSVLVMPVLYRRIKKKASAGLVVVSLAAITFFSMILFTENVKQDPTSLIPLFIMAAFIGVVDGMNRNAQKEKVTNEAIEEGNDLIHYMKQNDDIRLIGEFVAPTLLSLGLSESVFTYIDKTSIVGTIGVVSLGLLIVYIVISVWKSDQYYYLKKGKEERS